MGLNTYFAAKFFGPKKTQVILQEDSKEFKTNLSFHYAHSNYLFIPVHYINHWMLFVVIGIKDILDVS